MGNASRRAVIALVLFALAAPSGARAQSAPTPTDYPEAREIARLVFESGQYEAVLHTAVRVGLLQIKNVLEVQLRRGLTADELDGLHASLGNAFRTAVPRLVFEEASARTLAANVSQRDAQEMLAFYRTPLGAKLLALNVVLTRASEATTEEIIRARTPEFVRLFGSEVAQRLPGLAREIDAAARRPDGK